MQKKQGFTLIELLVVIAIIGILSAIGLTALTGAQAKARDVKRKADLNSLNASMTLWLDNAANTTGAYPLNCPGCAAAAAGPVDLMLSPSTPPNVKAASISGGFSIPKAPTPYGTNELSSYWYVSDGNSTGPVNPTQFALFTKLESTSTNTFFVSNSKGYSDVVTGTLTSAPIGTNVECTTTNTRSSASNYAPCENQPEM